MHINIASVSQQLVFGSDVWVGFRSNLRLFVAGMSDRNVISTIQLFSELPFAVLLGHPTWHHFCSQFIALNGRNAIPSCTVADPPDLIFVIPPVRHADLNRMLQEVDAASRTVMDDSSEAHLDHIVRIMTMAGVQSGFDKSRIGDFVMHHDQFSTVEDRHKARIIRQRTRFLLQFVTPEFVRQQLFEREDDIIQLTWIKLANWFRNNRPWDFDPDRPLMPFLRPQVDGCIRNAIRDQRDEL